MKRTVSALLAVLLTLSLAVGCFAGEDKELRFSQDGTFKILHLTDTQDDRYPAHDMLNFLRLAVQEADPDLIVFTGDLVEDSRIGDIATDDESFREGVVVKKGGEIDIEKTTANIEAAIEPVLSIFEESGVPYAIAQGNNDQKCGITNADWLRLFSKYPNCLINDESGDPQGGIDYNLEIKNSEGKTAFNIWLMDTMRGGVAQEQIDWYSEEAAALTQANGGVPVPALLFQHIQVADIGNLFEPCKMWDDGARSKDGKFYRLNPEIASGQCTFAYEPGAESAEFKAWKEQGDVIGAFFGHQHVEGFSGVWNGIELGFTYGCEMAKPGPYGYRLITLHEDDVKNYDNELYTYEGSVKFGNDRIEKQNDEPYPEYTDPLSRIFNGIKNMVLSVVYLIIGLFA